MRKLRPQPLEIFVKTTDGKKIALKVLKSTTAAEVKTKLQEKKGYVPSKIRLFYDGQQLEDDTTLEDYRVIDGSVMHMYSRLCGC